MEPVVNTLDLKIGIGNHIAGLGVPLQNCEVRELLVRRRDRDGAASVDGGLIDVGEHGRVQLGIRGRGAHFHKGVQALGHIGDDDGAVRLSFLGADDLPVLQDVEHSAGEGIAGIVLLQKLNLHLAVVLENKGNIGFAIPDKGLLDLALVGALGVTLRRGHFFRHITTDRHGVPGNVRQVAALAGDVGPGEAVIHACNLDNRSGKALGGIIGVYLADGALAAGGGRIHEGHRHRIVSVAGEDHILWSGVVDLITCGRFRFRHGIGAGVKLVLSVGAVRPGYNILGKRAVFGLDMELRPGKTLAGICGVHLLHNQGIVLVRRGGRGQFAQDHLLHGAGRMGGTASSGEVVLVHLTIAPKIRAAVEDKLGAVPKAPAVQLIVDAGVVGPFQGVIDCHELFGTGSHGIADAALLITPDTRLDPCVHVPGVFRTPYVIHASGFRRVGEYAG